MTDAERDELRSLQDRWLKLPHVRRQVELYGEDEPLALGYPGNPWPTFEQVRLHLHPELKGWFEDFFRGHW
jgi:hypothetical protein